MVSMRDDKDAQAMLSDLSHSIKELFLRTADTAAEANMNYRRFATVFLIGTLSSASLMAKASGIPRDRFLDFAKVAYDMADLSNNGHGKDS